MAFDWRTTRPGKLLVATLNALATPEDRALWAGLPSFAPAIPAAELSWDARTTYATTDEETGALEIKFGAPVFLNGLFFFCVPTARGGTAPSLDELDVNVENPHLRRYFTSQRVQTGANKGYVTATALDARTRLLNVVLAGSTENQLTITFRSKYASAGSSGLSNNVIISVVAVGTPLQQEG